MTRAWRKLSKIQRLNDFMSQVKWMGDCAEWQGLRGRQGYGRFYDGAKTEASHRVIWSWAHGPIPKGMCILHSCDNPPCVSLGHLRIGTYSDNTRDAVERKRQRNARKTACSRGHGYTPENTRMEEGLSGPVRRCRTCDRMKNRVAYRKERALAKAS